MRHKTLRIQLKTVLKGRIYATPLLRNLFIFLYKLNKCQPWGTGYSFYKFTYIRNTIEKNLHYFQKEALPQGYGAGLDERVVEYPWVFSRIKKEERVILDAGSSLNHWDILSLSCLQERTIYLTTLFYEGQYGNKNVMYRYEDLRELSFPDEYFDAAVCISTLEHVGMDNTCLYGTDEQKKENAPAAYLQAVWELKRVLKKGGALYLTMPYGAYQHHNWFQVFDAKMVDQLIQSFDPSTLNEKYFKYEHQQWNYSVRSSCQRCRFFDVHAESSIPEDHLAASESVVCLEMIK